MNAPHTEGARLDVRLDEEHRRKLKELASARGVPVSHVVREMIDQAYEAAQQQARLAAAEELCGLEVADVPDPQTLKRTLDAAHAIPDPYRR
jgi:predicted transcriptional regulator